MRTKSRIYTVGGIVQAKGGVYIPRPADNELLTHCQASEFCYVLTARQMGKSSLMVNTAERLANLGVRTVQIDLTEIGTKVTIDQWYLGLINVIVEDLNLDVSYEAWWEEHIYLGPTQRLNKFLRSVVLEAINERIVIFIDEIDTTLSFNFADDFFAAIRYMYNARSSDQAYHRLSFVLLGAATPGDLIQDPKRTPFNIGFQVDLTDFILDQVMPLGTGLELSRVKARSVLERVLYWTGGHPYLTQRLCSVLATEGKRPLDKNTIDTVVIQTFFGEQSKQDYNLLFVQDMLTKRVPRG